MRVLALRAKKVGAIAALLLLVGLPQFEFLLASDFGECLVGAIQNQTGLHAQSADHVAEESLQVAKVLRDHPAEMNSLHIELFAEQIPEIQSMLARVLVRETGKTLKSRYGQKVIQALMDEGNRMLAHQQATYNSYLDYSEASMRAIQTSLDQAWSKKNALKAYVPFSNRSVLQDFTRVPFSKDPTVVRAHKVGGVLIPTVVSLDIDHFNQVWGDRVFFIGMVDHPLRVDGVTKSPYEFFRHDVNHLMISMFALENMKEAARVRWQQVSLQIQAQLKLKKGSPDFWPLRAALFLSEHELALQKSLIEDEMPTLEATRAQIASRMDFRFKISKVMERVSNPNDLIDLLPPELRVHSTHEQRKAFLQETLAVLADQVSRALKSIN